MDYLLDTNICVHFFRGKFNILEKLEKVKPENCAISEITLAELVFGVEYSNNPEKNLVIINKFKKLITIIPIYNSVYLYGKEKARLRNSGNMISDFDLIIGCTSVEANLIMVTENVNEFKRISNIQIENWVDRTK